MIQNYAPVDAVFTGLPDNEGSAPTVYANLSAAVMSTSENKNEAWEFISLLLSEEFQRTAPGSNISGLPDQSLLFAVKLFHLNQNKSSILSRYIYSLTII